MRLRNVFFRKNKRSEASHSLVVRDEGQVAQRFIHVDTYSHAPYTIIFFSEGNEVIDINLYKYNSYVGHINPIKFKVSAGSIEDIESIENIATLCSGCLGIS